MVVAVPARVATAGAAGAIIKIIFDADAPVNSFAVNIINTGFNGVRVRGNTGLAARQAISENSITWFGVIRAVECAVDFVVGIVPVILRRGAAGAAVGRAAVLSQAGNVRSR